MMHTMKFDILIRDYVDDEAETGRKISPEKRQKLVAAYIREADEIERSEFISEPVGSESVPFYLANVLEHCTKEDTDRLPIPIRALVEQLITGALSYRSKAIDEAINAERERINSDIEEKAKINQGEIKAVAQEMRGF